MREGLDEAVGIGREERRGVTVAVEEGEVSVLGAADGGKVPANKQAAVALDPAETTAGEDATVGEGPNCKDRTGGAGVKPGVEPAVAVDEGETRAGRRESGTIGSERGEIAADQNRAVRKGGECVDRSIGRGVKI